MNESGKLQTITPALRNAAAVTSSASKPGNRANAGDEGFSIATGRATSGSVAPGTRISIDRAAKVSVAFFSIQNLLTLTPGWLFSFVSHVAVLILLTVIATSPLRDDAALRLDGLMVDPSPNADVEDMLDSIEQPEVDLLTVDVAALNSEASDEVADIVRDDGLEVSLLEGVADGIGMEAMANSGLTPIDNADEGGVEGTEGTSTKFFGTEASGSRFVFIIDASDSMNEGARWHQALNELQNSISQLNEEQKALVLLYNFQTFPMFDIAPEELKLLPVSGEFKSALTKWLNKQVPIGGTRPAHALSFSLSLKPDAIFLLSDGMLADNSIQILARDNPARNPKEGDFSKIPVHTISLGPSEEGARLMKFIAENNDGEFNWVN